MKKNARKSSSARKSAARKVRHGLMAVAMGVTGAAAAHAAPKVAPKPVTSGDAQIGTASWYGGKFNGRKTASGERFDMNALTAAHRSLPLGSWIRVTNLLNLKRIFVRVNDRGPVPRSRVLDLSRGAAQRLGIAGLGKVKIELIPQGDTRMTDPTTDTEFLQTLQILPTLIAER